MNRLRCKNTRSFQREVHHDTLPYSFSRDVQEVRDF
jgi:hypothetical protein